MSRVADLARGPDRYDRAELRLRMAVTSTRWPEHHRPLKDPDELRDHLLAALDRLDDAERLLEEGR